MKITKQSIRKVLPNFYHFCSFIKFYMRSIIGVNEYSILIKAKDLLNEKKLVVNPLRKILFFSARQDPDQLALSTIIRFAIQSQGYETLVLGCDQAIQRSCNSGSSPKLSSWQCLRCSSFAHKMYYLTNTKTDWMKQIIDDREVREANIIVNKLAASDLATFTYKNIVIGELVRVSVAHFLKSNTIDSSIPIINKIYRDWLKAAVIHINSFSRYLDQKKPDVVFMINGLFAPERIMLELCIRRKIEVICYEVGFKPQTFFFHRNQPVNMCNNEYWHEFINKELTIDQENRLDIYIQERNHGKGYLINYFPNINSNKEAIINELSIDISKKIFILFPNLTWDSTLYNCDLIFDSMISWIIETIAYFLDNPNFQLVIRSHPAESTLENADRELVSKIIKKHFPILPDNIKIISSESNISSYTMMDIAQCGIVYGSTTGIEMGLRGLPVIVCGKIYYRNLGITIDPNSKTEYFEHLNSIANDNYIFNKEESVKLFRKYAYYAIFRSAIPLKQLKYETIDEFPDFNFNSYMDLKLGKDKNLDIVTNGILFGNKFIVE